MKKVIVWFLVILSLTALLLRFSGTWTQIFFGVKQTSGISIYSLPSEATVFLDEKEVGKTPYDDKNLDTREYTVKISKDQASPDLIGASWSGKVKLRPGTVTVINRDIALDSASSAGETLTLDKGKGITVISNPSESDVEIDGKVSGKTPLTLELDAGEHTILVSHTNYLKRSIRAALPNNFNLTVSVDLALSEADLTVVATPTITQTPEVAVLQTPTGFLRVRDKPGLNGKEVAQVKPGDILVLLEDQGSWDRVRLPGGTEGFVSSSYVEKKK